MVVFLIVVWKGSMWVDVEMIELEAYLKIAQTGDICFFSDAKKGYRMILGTPWNHVGMLVRGASDCLLESNMYTETSENAHMDLLSMSYKDGMQLVSFRDKVSKYNGRVAVRRLRSSYPEFNSEAYRLDKLSSIITQKNSIDFEKSAIVHGTNLLYKNGLIPLSLEYKDRTGKYMFCSQVVCRALRLLGALHPLINEWIVYPQDFLNANIHLLKEDWMMDSLFQIK